jgi:DDE domain/Protein of unknown function (DUF2937)
MSQRQARPQRRAPVARVDVLSYCGRSEPERASTAVLRAYSIQRRGLIGEEVLAERGLDISYETVRCWVLKFGPVITRRLRRRPPQPSNRWHPDEMVVRIAGERMYLWRAVDHEGEVFDMLVQPRRDSRAALRLMRKVLKKQGCAPKLLVTDKLRSYASAFRRQIAKTVFDNFAPQLDLSFAAAVYGLVGLFLGSLLAELLVAALLPRNQLAQ